MDTDTVVGRDIKLRSATVHGIAEAVGRAGEPRRESKVCLSLRDSYPTRYILVGTHVRPTRSTASPLLAVLFAAQMVHMYVAGSTLPGLVTGASSGSPTDPCAQTPSSLDRSDSSNCPGATLYSAIHRLPNDLLAFISDAYSILIGL